MRLVRASVRNTTCLLAFGAGLSVVASEVPGAEDRQEIYVSTGEHGEVSFSDEAAPGAERVVIETSEPAEDPMAELDRRIAQTLAVANDLEESRLQREEARLQARAEARAAEAQARAQPEVVYQDRYVSSPYLYPRPFRPGRPHKPPHGPPGGGPEEPEPPAEETISKSFPTKD